jgi:hypothetical protein
MRYILGFTPPPRDPLTSVAASWLGRDVYSGERVEQLATIGLGLHEAAFYSALPRRYGFHAALKSPFRLAEPTAEAALLRDLMRYSGTFEPFHIPRLEVARIGSAFALIPSSPHASLNYLAAALTQEFDHFRAPLTEAEIDRCDPDLLSATQFANLHRWGCADVMDEFRFQMLLTGPVHSSDVASMERVLRTIFDPVLTESIVVSNIALMMEESNGGPFRVHSLHPMGRVGVRKSA